MACYGRCDGYTVRCYEAPNNHDMSLISDRIIYGDTSPTRRGKQQFVIEKPISPKGT